MLKGDAPMQNHLNRLPKVGMEQPCCFKYPKIIMLNSLFQLFTK